VLEPFCIVFIIGFSNVFIVVVPEIKQKPCQFFEILYFQRLRVFWGEAWAEKSRVPVTDEPGFCYAMFVWG
jgi:hypothetical protein